MLKATDINY